MKGLSRGAIATGYIKGVKPDKGHGSFYNSSAPSIKVKPTSSCDGIDWVSMTREQIRFAWVSSLLFLVPEPPSGRPFIYMGCCPAGLQSSEASSYKCPARSLPP